MTGKLIVSGTVGIFFLLSATSLQAGENYRSEYYSGITDLGVGYLPKPGRYFDNFSLFTSGELKLSRSHYDALVAADALSFLQVSHVEILGTNWSWLIRVPFAYGNLALRNSEDQITKNGNSFALADVAISPFILGWHAAPVHMTVATLIYAPTGGYHEGNLVNIGRNLWALEEDFGVTWLSPEHAFEISTLLGYTVPFTNSATHYTSGQEFHSDFTFACHLSPHWTAALAGYEITQTTRDSAPDATLGSGAAFALGPLISWSSATTQPTRITLKDYFDVSAKNRYAGQSLWIVFSRPID